MRTKLIIILFPLIALVQLHDTKAQESYNLEERPFFDTIVNTEAKSKLQEARQKDVKGIELKGRATKRYRKAEQRIDYSADTTGANKGQTFGYKWSMFWGEIAHRRALRKFTEANQIRHTVYKNHLPKVRKDTSSRVVEKAKKYENKANELFAKTKPKKNNLPEERSAKIDTLQSIDSIQLQAINKQQLAFGLYMNDSLAKEIVIEEEKPKNLDAKLSTLNNYESDYKLAQDNNIYKSNENKIFSRLNLIREEEDSLNTAKNYISHGDSLYRSLNNTFAKIHYLKQRAKEVTASHKKENLKSEAVTLEQKAYHDLVKMAQRYTKANTIKFKILKDYIAKNAKSLKYIDSLHIRSLTKTAGTLKNTAEELRNIAKNKRFRSEKYRFLMEANGKLLSAIRKLEGVYSIIFNLEKSRGDVPIFTMFEISKEDLATTKIPDSTGTSKEKSKKADKEKDKESYKIKKRYTYTRENPDPKPYSAKEGLHFRIQTGILKNVPDTAMHIMSPVYVEEFSDSPFRRFYLGKFKTLEASKYARDKIRKTRFNDAFVVPFLNGKRTSLNRAQKILNNNTFLSDEEYNTRKKQELQALKAPGSSYKKGKARIAGVLENTEDMVFTVQLRIGNEVPSKKQIAGIDSVWRGNSPVGTRYTYGIFDNYSSALKTRNKLHNNGLKKGFVIAYNDGAWIEINKARKLYSLKNEETDERSGEEVTYRVQIGAFKEKGRFDKLRNKLEITEIPGNNGIITYNVGKFTDYSKAVEKRDNLLSKGIEGFVVAYKGGKKIKLTEAKKSKQKTTSTALSDTAKNSDTEDSTDIAFKVQVGAYNEKLTKAEKRDITAVTDEWKLEMKKDNKGRFIYLLGKFRYYEEAVKFRKKLNNKGIDGFVVAYENNTKISLSKARKK